MEQDIRPAPSSEEEIRLLADQMRQALQTCSVHTVGPLAAYEKCTMALDDGRIDRKQFQDIGRRLVTISQERMRTYEDQGERPGESHKISREERMICFVDALFALGVRDKEG